MEEGFLLEKRRGRGEREKTERGKDKDRELKGKERDRTAGSYYLGEKGNYCGLLISIKRVLWLRLEREREREREREGRGEGEKIGEKVQKTIKRVRSIE